MQGKRAVISTLVAAVGCAVTLSAGFARDHGRERGAVAVFPDITDRKHVENELRGFAGVVAHDLKAPLSAVRGYAELIVEALAADPDPDAVEDVLRSAGKVMAGADRMHTLIMEALPNPGGGTIFVFTVPAATAEQELCENVHIF